MEQNPDVSLMFFELMLRCLMERAMLSNQTYLAGLNSGSPFTSLEFPSSHNLWRFSVGHMTGLFCWAHDRDLMKAGRSYFHA